MEYQIRAESGKQLLARLSTRPGLGGLDERLFGLGPAPHDIIEVTGEASVGKTMLLMHWTAQAILAPADGGLGAGVLLVDTDHHQPLFTLVRLLEFRIKLHYSTLGQRANSSTVESSIKDALKRLTITSVYDSTQLYTGLLALDKVLLSNRTISLVLVDSLPAFYWADRLSGGLQHMDSYQKRLLSALRDATQSHRVTVVFTHPSYFQSAVASRSKSSVTSTLYVSLCREEEAVGVKGQKNDLFCATVRSATGHNILKYRINKDGIFWI